MGNCDIAAVIEESNWYLSDNLKSCKCDLFLTKSPFISDICLSLHLCWNSFTCDTCCLGSLSSAAMYISYCFCRVGDRYLSCTTYQFSLDKSTHILLLSVPFVGVTTIGTHHCIPSVTGVIISCCWSRSIH